MGGGDLDQKSMQIPKALSGQREPAGGERGVRITVPTLERPLHSVATFQEAQEQEGPGGLEAKNKPS